MKQLDGISCRSNLAACLAVLLQFLLLWTVVPPALADEGVRIGVLAVRSAEQTQAQFRSTALWLESRIPGKRFRIVPLGFNELDSAVRRHEVDFLAANPETYVRLRHDQGLAAIATLMPLAGLEPVTQFGGVIFTRADRQDIKSLEDVRGRKVVSVGDMSLGGYLVERWTLMKAGIRLPEDVREIRSTGMPHDQPVLDVLAGRADIGFTRTGIIEAMQQEGRIAAGSLKILNRQAQEHFPLALSTDLFPEWPVMALRHVPEPLVKAVTLALLTLPPDGDAASQGGFYGFSPPADYSPVEALMLRLRVHPNQSEFALEDILAKYAGPLLAMSIGLMLVAAAVALQMRRKTRALATALAETERLSLRGALLQSLGVGVFGLDIEGRCTFINAAALRMLGFAEHEVTGQSSHALFLHHHPDGSEYPRQGCPICQSFRSGGFHGGEEHLVRKDGSFLPVAYSVTPVIEQGQVSGAVVAFQDISEQKSMREKLATQEQLLRTILDTISEGVEFHDAQGCLVFSNHQTSRLQDGAASGPPTVYLDEEGRVCPPEELPMNRALSTQRAVSGALLRSDTAEPRWLSINATPLVDPLSGKTTGVVTCAFDVTGLKEQARQLQELAHFDALTRLPNRTLLADRIEQAMARSQRNGDLVAVCLLDLDGFKQINDQHGHQVGDLLLVEAARRLRENLRGADTAARLGGDEFALLLGDLHSDSQCQEGVQRILRAIALPYTIGGIEMRVSASIGVTLYPNDGADADHLMRHADAAMYQAKQNGKNCYRFFDAANANRGKANRSTAHKIERAITKGELALVYQPVVDCREGRIVGAEALVRWRHPILGLLAPAEFLPLIEGSEAIVHLDDWVLAEVVRQAEAWQGLGLDLGVNISAGYFRRPNFAQALQDVPGIAGVAKRLCIEIPESVALENVAAAGRYVAQCHELGLRVTLDDFGSGFCSLAHLKRLAPDELKIDRSMIHDSLEDPDTLAIIEGILGMSRAFKARTVTKGVENIDQVFILLEMGCDLMQGNGLSRPLAAEAFEAWLADFHPDPCWQLAATPRPSRSDFYLLLAEANYRFWVDSLLARARNASNLSESELEARAARFEQWVSGMGASRYGQESFFARVRPLLDKSRHLGERLLDCGGDEAGALARALLQAREGMIATLSGLRHLEASADKLLRQGEQA